MLRGTGNGSFVNSTYEAGLNDEGEHRGLAWVDNHSDGWMDLVVTGRNFAPRYYRNILFDSPNHYLQLQNWNFPLTAPLTVFFCWRA